MAAPSALFAFAALSLGLLGCSGIGPSRLGNDHLQYARAISEAQKRQILLNIVRLRYGDTPTFLTVDQVISSYTLEQQAELGLNVYPNVRSGNYATGLAGATYSDHPTITFSPLSGEDLARTSIQPPSPAILLPLADSGLPIDLLFRLGVQSVGAWRNTIALAGQEGAGAPEFFELLAVMRRLQVRGLLTVRFERKKDANHVFLGIANDRDPAWQATAGRARTLLGMPVGRTEAEVVYGRAATEVRQIAILTRPIIAVLGQLGAEIEVPPEDVAAGRTIPSIFPGAAPMEPIIRIHAGKAPPQSAYVAVVYGDAWFWIDNGDFNSKVGYAILQLLIAFVEGSNNSRSPVLTIPAG